MNFLAILFFRLLPILNLIFFKSHIKQKFNDLWLFLQKYFNIKNVASPFLPPQPISSSCSITSGKPAAELPPFRVKRWRRFKKLQR